MPFPRISGYIKPSLLTNDKLFYTLLLLLLLPLPRKVRFNSRFSDGRLPGLPPKKL